MIQNKISATVESVHQHCKDTRSFILKLENPLPFIAGQFIMANVPYKNTFVRRAYSIASNPGSSGIELCLNEINGGIASNFFFNMKAGAKFQVDGPYGIFRVKSTPTPKLFIATGTGIAPIRSMILNLLSKDVNQQVTLIFGERTEDDLLYRKEFEALAVKHQKFTYIPTLSKAKKGWKGAAGYVQHVMKKYINEPNHIEVYICGLKEMVDDVRKILMDMGVDAKNILSEKFV